MSPFNPPPPGPGPVSLPVLPPDWPKAKVTPILDAALALLQQPWDPFNHAQHEAVMNSWLIKEVQNENAATLQKYLNAWSNYRLNAQRFAELGLPVPVFSTPAPVLQDVGPMPDGWWFGTHP